MMDEPILASDLPSESGPKGRSWESRIVAYDDVDPSELNANPMNWRVHDERQEKALLEALEKAGWVQTVIVNRTTGNVVDGHLRVSLAQREGWNKIPVSYVELDETEEALVLATLDPIASLAVVDEGAFKGLFSDIEDQLGEALHRLTTDIVPPDPRDRLDALPTQDQIDKRQEQMESRWEGVERGHMVDLVCPECGGEHAINLDHFNDTRYDG